MGLLGCACTFGPCTNWYEARAWPSCIIHQAVAVACYPSEPTLFIVRGSLVVHELLQLYSWGCVGVIAQYGTGSSWAHTHVERMHICTFRTCSSRYAPGAGPCQNVTMW
jgi:hypothetical protein